MPSVIHLGQVMMNGFLIVLVRIIFVVYGSSSVLTLHQMVQF